MIRKQFRSILATICLVVAGCAVGTAPRLADPLDRARDQLAALEQHEGGHRQVGFGVQLQWDQDSPAGYEERTGRQPVLYGEFVEFPFGYEVATWLGEKVAQVEAEDAILMLTLEPRDGLHSITDAVLADLTQQLTDWNEAGTPVLVRFAHEMNGSWYPWGQQPSQYIATFRAVADAVRAAPASRILWSPNEGGGYPFDGPYAARPGTLDYSMLDTNEDGEITPADDPYAPYYPGDAHVNWVGLSLYHFGEAYPWGENAVPEPDKFVGKLTGTFHSAAVDETSVPDFYAEYADSSGKPLAISETSALYNTGRDDGASNLEIKSTWWDQVFAPDLPKRFPQLRLINWFEQDKSENDVHDGEVRWAATREPALRDALLARVPEWLVFAPE
ncbi:glycosyl hydrolase [Blastococcus mobilis]|uniref:Glycosyl hydrolase family 26 n=1 Tax=Blastococcus mobilis TaxID=1938746 RepID=A0A238W3V7_9ACTN|nr:glycosyl hydrolase [Blastococcus mobilis]SNR40399.1 Glycosyl hydrolase family 26 [Blastococcus mobilis]